jgi:ABC-type polysaccharide/polyol phosphate transport system ATPase subunit
MGQGRDFIALDDINFTVYQGETFGIIGKNGSGKSTMLQILAGILKPSQGEAEVQGKVSALLELGSGFNPENTGIENIYMNAAILGVDKKRIKEKISSIIEFADIGDFIYQPVKTYSSGMYVRLGFAVAINVDADIILIDEALAVGDIFFRQKCYARLNQLKEEGKTIILVTHGMNEVEQFCDRALLIDHGRQIELDSSRLVVKKYYLLDQGTTQNADLDFSADDTEPQGGLYDTGYSADPGNSTLDKWAIREDVFFDLSQSEEVSNGKARFIRAGIFDKDGKAARVFTQGDTAYFYAQIEILEDIAVPMFGTLIVNQKNIILSGKASSQTYCDVPMSVKKGEIVTVVEKVALNLEAGEMTVEFGFAEYDEYAFLNRSLISNEELFARESKICIRSNIGVFAILQRKSGAPTRLTHYGVCDLPTEFSVRI